MPAPLQAVGGQGETIQDPNWKPPLIRVWDLPNTPRAITLRARSAFVSCEQHDHLRVSWEGTPRDPGVGYLQERMRPHGFVPTNAAPYGDRKPDASVPLPRQVTISFTDMLFGEGRYPALQVSADTKTERYVDEIMKESNTWDAMIEARDMAGGCGSAALSVAVEDGEPMTETHHPADLWVRQWKPGAKWIPVEVVEQRLVRIEYEDEDGQIASRRMWRTRMWTETHVVHYKDVPEDWGQDEENKNAPIPVDGVVEHKAGRCPVVWYQNTRNSKSPEGETDMTGAYHLSDRLDRFQSMVVRGSIANIDPTLVRKIDDRLRRRRPVERKGHGALIDVGPTGDAKLLEITGSSIEMGWNGVRELRNQTLQTVGCVIVDPESAGAYKSGEALALLWRRMESRCNRFRVPATTVLRQLASLWIALGNAWGVTSVEDPDKGGIVLPPLTIEEPQPEPAPGEPVPEPKVVTKPHEVGDGKFVNVVWPPYHVPTANQLQAMATALATANGQKATISQETATAEMVGFLGRGDPSDERRRIEEEQAKGREQFAAAMFPGGESETDVRAEKAAAADSEAEDQAAALPAAAESKTE